MTKQLCPRCNQPDVLGRHSSDCPLFDTAPPSGGYFSEAQNVLVENRGGVGFGKVFICWKEGRFSDQVEAVMLWTAAHGLSDCDGRVSSDEQRSRAVKAM